jgi:UDP:flavonoid glycosyltransferase YjiC (YdhE family)
MAVILAYGSPALGHLFPLAALLSELAERGHHVHLQTMSGGINDMRAAGIHAEPVDTRIEAIVGPDWMARNGQFVPHSVLIDRACCVVTHGGMGTTVKALDRGVPVCVVPFARDQAEVARRVEVARCGVRLPAGKLTALRLREAVRSAMTMVDGARRVAAGLAATGGVARGAELVEQHLLRSVGREVAE